MPHLTLVCTKNLADFDAYQVLGNLNEALAGTDGFTELDIKSRALRLDHFAFGKKPSGRAFVHVKLLVSAGRNAETKSALSNLIVDIWQRMVSPKPHLHRQIFCGKAHKYGHVDTRAPDLRHPLVQYGALNFRSPGPESASIPVIPFRSSRGAKTTISDLVCSPG